MEKHQLGELMDSTMSKIREMVDVNTVVGQPIATPDGITVIPVSKVSFGFASGGSDFAAKGKGASADNNFGGGSGAGVNISPVAFLVIKDGAVRLINVAPTEHSAIDNVIDMVPEVVDKITNAMGKKKAEKEAAAEEAAADLVE